MWDKAEKSAEKLMISQEITTEPFRLLAYAIVIAALRDLAELNRARVDEKSLGGYPVSRWEIKSFFEGDWCARLLGECGGVGDRLYRENIAVLPSRRIRNTI